MHLPRQIASPIRNRRRFSTQLTAALAVCTSAVTMPVHAQGLCTLTDNPVTCENRNPGTTNWKIGNPMLGTGPRIEGYANETSVNRGEDVHLFINASPAAAAQFEVFRMGWYGGLGGRSVYGPIS